MRFTETRPDPCSDSLFLCTGIDTDEDGEIPFIVLQFLHIYDPTEAEKLLCSIIY